MLQDRNGIGGLVTWLDRPSDVNVRGSDNFQCTHINISLYRRLHFTECVSRSQLYGYEN